MNEPIYKMFAVKDIETGVLSGFCIYGIDTPDANAVSFITDNIKNVLSSDKEIEERLLPHICNSVVVRLGNICSDGSLQSDYLELTKHSYNDFMNFYLRHRKELNKDGE